MYTSQLLLVLRSFQKKEQQHFDRYLHSPYFHDKPPSAELLGLWDYLKQGLEEPQEAYFAKAQVYQALFPGQKVFKSKLEKLMSQLYAEVKNFLVFQQFQKGVNDKKKRLYLLAAFNERKLKGHFQQLYDKINKTKSDQDLHWETHFFEDQFFIEREMNTFQSFFRNRETDLNLANTHFYLDLFFLVKKLEYALQLLARNLFVFPVDATESLQVLEELIPHLPPKYTELPIVQLYLRAYHLLQSFYEAESEIHYQQFTSLLQKHEANIPFEQLRSLQTFNRSYLTAKYKKDSPSYLAPLFTLYQCHLSRGFLYQKDQIFPGTLANIVLLGLRHKAYDWVHQFLQDHKNKIGGTPTPNIVFQYNLGQYFFAIQAFDQALQSIAHTYDDPFYKIAARRLEVKVFYELDADIFEAKLTAFKLYVYRLVKSSVHADKMLGNHHFVDLLKQIWRPGTYKNDSRIDKLIAKAKQLEHLADREWIIEKLEALR